MDNEVVYGQRSPAVYFFQWWKYRLSCVDFALQEPLQIKEARRDNFILEVREPCRI